MDFSRVADFPLTVEGVGYTQQERDTSSGFVRKSTTFVLSDGDETGRGEDVTYDTPDHDALPDPDSEAFGDAFDLAGEYTFASFSNRLDEIDLFPAKEPERDTGHHYRRWGLESAGLDLALRQAGESLGSVLGREYSPVRFVASTRLGEPPSTDRVDAILDRVPNTEFKLDPTTEWTPEIVESLAATDAVRILDIKGRYEGTEVDQEPDPELYRLVFEGFPDAVVEDPALVPETEEIVEAHAERLSWDVPITGVESVEALPYPPNWLNIKPSRFGTVESLFETLAYADERGIALYGGGQFELDVGRPQIQALASLCYPDGPNDVAPGVYNDPDLPDDLPTSPLDPGEPAGLGF
ncbi:hypothetical protein [Salinigranum marinum]|uniref:hypothetical protein n=1 Tax=Salinigranum marinum TaxID=1515595 RepID=UPI002989C57C|nr:hypothetical protein [Salinigranum marinum]